VTGTVIEGWPKRGRNEHFTEAEIGQIRSAYRNGVSVIDIARGLRCSRRNVYKHLEHVTAGDRALRKALRPKIEPAASTRSIRSRVSTPSSTTRARPT
jgi:hypothetical protein